MGLALKEVLFDGRVLKLSTDKVKKDEANLVTVIVGKNSVGKSRLLSAIVKVFDATDNKSHGLRRERDPEGRPKPSIDGFKLIYEKNGQTNELTVDHGKLHSEHMPEKSRLPSRVIATSTSPFDKFPVEGRRTNDVAARQAIYSYLGTKTVFGQYSSLAQLTRVVDSLLLSLNNSVSELNKLNHVFEFLQYAPLLRVKYRLKFNPYTSEKLISSSTEEAIEYLNRYSYPSYTRSTSIKRKELVYALDVLKSVLTQYPDSRAPEFLVNLSTGEFNIGSPELYQQTKILRQLGLMQLTDFVLHPIEKSPVGIKDASSGEQCVIVTILGIASKIKDNSVICIDEPEISLHPEWQEEFIELLLNTFTGYKGCHFLIATHSPQIVSKLSDNNCYILTMDDGNLRSSKDYSKKSADFQLANIFKAPGFNNEYLNRESVSILTKISKTGKIESDDKARMDKLIDLIPLIDEGDSVKQLLYIVKETMEKLLK